MAMVSADGSSQSFGRLTAQIGWFGLRIGSHPALSLYSSNEPGELSQWLCHDDSTINIVSNIIILYYVWVKRWIFNPSLISELSTTELYSLPSSFHWDSSGVLWCWWCWW